MNCWSKEKQCNHHNKFGHIEANCWSNEKHGSYAKEDQEESKLFMTNLCLHKISSDVWFVDTGCSSHMSSKGSIFKELDEP